MPKDPTMAAESQRHRNAVRRKNYDPIARRQQRQPTTPSKYMYLISFQ